jgi:excisionase family DNA binding protein
MNYKDFRAELYPITVQIVVFNGQLFNVIYQPDFKYRVSEPYRPEDMGQTELLIMKMRRDLRSKVETFARTNIPIPDPSKPKNFFGEEDMDQTLSTKDVARLLSISEMSIRRLADDGTLPCKKTPKGHRRFKRSDVERFLQIPNHSPTPELKSQNLNAKTLIGNS